MGITFTDAMIHISRPNKESAIPSLKILFLADKVIIQHSYTGSFSQGLSLYADNRKVGGPYAIQTDFSDLISINDMYIRLVGR
jgi:hypothetical protein